MSKSNMYDFVSPKTYNGISGKCPHKCVYCYVTTFYNDANPQKEMHLNETFFRQELKGDGRLVFIGSGFDMFAWDVPKEWIGKVLEHCRKFDNTYLFQSKNPMRFLDFLDQLPKKVVLATTIESNKVEGISKAPLPSERAAAMSELGNLGYKTMVTIEPILDFDKELFLWILKTAAPDWINVGADSKHHSLKEPSKEKTLELIEELKTFTEVRLKDNLKRLIG